MHLIPPPIRQPERCGTFLKATARWTESEKKRELGMGEQAERKRDEVKRTTGMGTERPQPQSMRKGKKH